MYKPVCSRWKVAYHESTSRRGFGAQHIPLMKAGWYIVPRKPANYDVTCTL